MRSPRVDLDDMDEVILDKNSDLPERFLPLSDSQAQLLKHHGYCLAWDSERDDGVTLKYRGEDTLHGRNNERGRTESTDDAPLQ